ncbi:MAG: poly-gamma-glutamate synthase PgsB, partial [Deltaproteobacteria bacterium]|nr:poly-gamma-glutamate synthase PgsB [Deltaproteobacteria bacterium]
MLFFFLLLSVCAFLAVEKIRHARRLSRIPIRIHVNGTRGKSNVTRLIAASLRRSGIRTLAKTTGTTPRLILPDGTEKAIRRWAPANILEQVRTVRIADRMKATALVIECMALDPMLQAVSERRMIRSTMGVITNVRPDHFEVMGDSLDDIAEALSQSIPENGVLVTGESAYHPFFASVASARGSGAVLANGAGAVVEPADLPAGRFLFPENIAIARSVLRLLGLDPAAVSQCLDEEPIVRESAGVSHLCLEDREVHFVDAFSANDVTSTRIIQERAFAGSSLPRPRVALFNNRADRPLRMQSFALSLLGDPSYDYVAVIGECRRLARRFI